MKTYQNMIQIVLGLFNQTCQMECSSSKVPTENKGKALSKEKTQYRLIRFL